MGFFFFGSSLISPNTAPPFRPFLPVLPFVLVGLDNLPGDILLWCSIMQWMGGIGIIGMAVAILPFLRIGGMRLFATESSEWTEKAVPRTNNLARGLAFSYLALTLSCILTYWVLGMDLFNAVNHALTTVDC